MAGLSGTEQRVRILVSDTGRGLWRDAELLAGIIRDHGLTPEMIRCPPRSERVVRWVYRFDRIRSALPQVMQSWFNRVHAWLFRTYPDPTVLCTIHLQRIHTRFVAGPHENWLFPNPEWYQPVRIPYLAMMDRVLCKTHDAEKSFRPLSDNVTYTGFSGLLPEPGGGGRKDFRRFLHVAGNNRKKGTDSVVRAWNNHPEWPTLDLVIEDRARLPFVPENVRVHERISDETLDELRDECGIAVAPSEAEGFGHVLLDAMACGQIVVTVDAPPMNELVDRDRGFLVGWSRSRPCRLGTQYYVDQQELEAAISEALAEGQTSLEMRSGAARDWVISNDQAFRDRMHALLEELIHGC